MIKFQQINSLYLPLCNRLYSKYITFLEDDYNEDTLADIVSRVYPFFWIILSNKTFAGFVYLDNIIGNQNKMHSAELTTCVDPRFWGDFTKQGAKIFLEKCFKEFQFTKIKALIYPQNQRVKTLLKTSGFVKEATLKSETLRRGCLQDIEIYSLFNQRSNT